MIWKTRERYKKNKVNCSVLNDVHAEPNAGEFETIAVVAGGKASSVSAGYPEIAARSSHTVTSALILQWLPTQKRLLGLVGKASA